MKLPYSYDALEPLMSKETLEYHHDKHHQTYVNKLNELIIDTKYETMSLEEIIKNSDGPIFNNAAQVHNHDLFFMELQKEDTQISPELNSLIVEGFGTVENFKAEFITKATTNFGSGWVWLVLNKKGSLEIIATSNAATPFVDGLKLLMVVDVWEHAYYIDYRNVRPEYLENWWKLVNWDFVSSRLSNN
jgi:Fe-Mn family superoxide dismutase